MKSSFIFVTAFYEVNRLDINGINTVFFTLFMGVKLLILLANILIKTNNMKKFLQILTLLMIFIVVACGTKKTDKGQVASKKVDDLSAGTMIDSFQIHFAIDGDDKEHQDAVAVGIYDPQHRQLVYKEVCPPMPDDGTGDAYHWRSDQPGRDYPYYLTPSSPIPADSLQGYFIQIVSGYTSGQGAFQSWNALIHLDGILNNGKVIPIEFLAPGNVKTTVRPIAFPDENLPNGENVTIEFTIFSE